MEIKYSYVMKYHSNVFKYICISKSGGKKWVSKPLISNCVKNSQQSDTIIPMPLGLHHRIFFQLSNFFTLTSNVFNSIFVAAFTDKKQSRLKWWYLLLWSHSFSKGRFNSLRLTKQFIRHMVLITSLMNASVVQPSAVLPKMKILHMHLFDVIMNTIASQITSLTVDYWIFFQTQIKGNIKSPCYWPLLGEFTGLRWIPRTKSQ